jgi:hypothetical protein
MLESHVGIGIGQQRDQVGLDEQVARQQVAQQFVTVVRDGTDTVDQNTASSAHMAEIRAPRLVTEEA